MNLKNVMVLVLAALFAVSACKRKKAEPVASEPVKTEPAQAPEPAKTEPAPMPEPPKPEPVATADNPCMGYVERTLACAKEMAGGVDLPAEAVEATKKGAEEGCAMMAQTPGAGESLAKALEACAGKPCAEFAACVPQEMAAAAAAAAGVPAPAVPTPTP
ncbi:MAG: hypothetical protein QME96_00500 [Myxococcota bacterium]|nr:hypothetical protein [Myxococcota bacterium]